MISPLYWRISHVWSVPRFIISRSFLRVQIEIAFSFIPAAIADITFLRPPTAFHPVIIFMPAGAFTARCRLFHGFRRIANPTRSCCRNRVRIPTEKAHRCIRRINSFAYRALPALRCIVHRHISFAHSANPMKSSAPTINHNGASMCHSSLNTALLSVPSFP